MLRGRWSKLFVPVAITALLGSACRGSADMEEPTPDRSGLSSLPQGADPVELDPEDFTTEIDNPYFPLVPGTRWTYRETDESGSELKVVVVVTTDTKEIANGITAASSATPSRRMGRSWRTRRTGTRRIRSATFGIWARTQPSSRTGRCRPDTGLSKPESTARSPASSCLPILLRAFVTGRSTTRARPRTTGRSSALPTWRTFPSDTSRIWYWRRTRSRSNRTYSNTSSTRGVSGWCWLWASRVGGGRGAGQDRPRTGLGWSGSTGLARLVMRSPRRVDQALGWPPSV